VGVIPAVIAGSIPAIRAEKNLKVAEPTA